MSDSPPTPSSSRSPRLGGADPNSQPPAGLTGLFRSWLRSALRGKADASWRETIEELIEDGGSDSEPSVAAHERTLLANILRLKDLTAIDVMVPRVDIVAIEISTPIPEVLRLSAAEAHSRMPVYRETLDDVLGMVHIKDVLVAVAGGGDLPKLSDIIRNVLIVAPSMPVLDLLLEMRQNRQHMALVVDEFGGIDGLITIEDLVELIVGEIDDEHDEASVTSLVERPDGTIVADARVAIEDFEKLVGSILDDEEREDVDTLGGLVFSIAGRIPARGELLRHPSGLEFEVMDADPRRIKRLRVRRAGEPKGRVAAEAPKAESA